MLSNTEVPTRFLFCWFQKLNHINSTGTTKLHCWLVVLSTSILFIFFYFIFFWGVGGGGGLGVGGGGGGGGFELKKNVHILRRKQNGWQFTDISSKYFVFRVIFLYNTFLGQHWFTMVCAPRPELQLNKIPDFIWLHMVKCGKQSADTHMLFYWWVMLSWWQQIELRIRHSDLILQIICIVRKE